MPCPRERLPRHLRKNRNVSTVARDRQRVIGNDGTGIALLNLAIPAVISVDQDNIVVDNAAATWGAANGGGNFP